MKIKFRLRLTYMILEENFDGGKEAEKREAHLTNKQVHTITKTTIENAIDEQTQETTTNIEEFDQRDLE